MGARGPISHGAKGKRTFGNRRGGAEVVALPAVSVPVAPERLGDAGRMAWSAAFASAPWLRSDVDVDLAGQWADLHDEREELRGLVAEHGRTARGSMGQQVDSPYVTQLRAVEAQILRLAAVLGLGPQNAARLGVAVTQIHRRAPSVLDALRQGTPEPVEVLPDVYR